jgi:hypothetical protein
MPGAPEFLSLASYVGLASSLRIRAKTEAKCGVLTRELSSVNEICVKVKIGERKIR